MIGIKGILYDVQALRGNQMKNDRWASLCEIALCRKNILLENWVIGLPGLDATNLGEE